MTVKTPARLALTASLAAVLVLGLTQCGKKGDTAAPEKAEPSKTLYAYDVALTLTPKAVTKLGSGKVIVNAFYFGAPSEAARDKVNDAGQITLGEDEVTVDAKTQTLRLTGYGIDPVALKSVTDGKPSVEVTAWSETTAKNLLKCSVFKDSVAVAQSQPVAISCDAAK